MHIGIDYTAAAWQGAGIGRYARELIRAIVAQGNAHRYSLFYAAGGLAPDSPYIADLRQLCDTYANVSRVPIPLSPRRLTQLWQRLRIPLPVELFTGRIDLLHGVKDILPVDFGHVHVEDDDVEVARFGAVSVERFLTVRDGCDDVAV